MMKFLKPLSMSLIALAASAAVTAAIASDQPFVPPASVSIQLDSSAIKTGYAIQALYGAKWDQGTGTLSLPLQAVTTSTEPGPLLVRFQDTGVKLSGRFMSTLYIDDLRFDLGTSTLYGDVYTGGIFPIHPFRDVALVTARQVTSSFGAEAGTSVTSSLTPRALNLTAQNFVLAEGFKERARSLEADITELAFLPRMFTSIQVTTPVPEPSSHVLTGFGLVAMAVAARRRRMHRQINQATKPSSGAKP